MRENNNNKNERERERENKTLIRRGNFDEVGVIVFLSIGESCSHTGTKQQSGTRRVALQTRCDADWLPLEEVLAQLEHLVVDFIRIHQHIESPLAPRMENELSKRLQKR